MYDKEYRPREMTFQIQGTDMIVLDILYSPNAYIGQEIKVEGVLIQQGEDMDNQWYLIPEGEPLSLETMTRKGIRLNHTIEDRYMEEIKHISPPSPQQFIEACSQPASPISKENASQIWVNLMNHRQYKYLDQFIQAGALPLINKYYAPDSASYFPNTNSAQIRTRLYPLPKEKRPEYYFYSGYVVGYLRRLENGKLELYNLSETLQETGYYTHIERSKPVTSDQESMTLNNITTTFDIVNNPSQYLGKTLRIEGHIPLHEFNKQLKLMPFPIYALLKDKETQSLTLDQSMSHIQSVVKRSVLAPLIETTHTNPVHIIGTLVPSQEKPHGATITQVSEMLIQTNVYAFNKYRNLDVQLEQAPF